MTEIIIHKEALTISDNTITRSSNIRDVTKLFEKGRITYPKVEAAKSNIHTYDNYGVWAYEQEGIMTQISLLFSKPFLDFHPTKKFIGSVVIDDISITNTDDILSLDSDEMWMDEWEAEGSATFKLGNIACSISVETETKKLEEVNFWFIN
jgi:hypothetical protein